jgi:hypothetical protein
MTGGIQHSRKPQTSIKKELSLNSIHGSLYVISLSPSTYTLRTAMKKFNNCFQQHPSKLLIHIVTWELKGTAIAMLRHFRRETDMETPYRKDCSQGLVHLRKNLFSFQKWAFKYKYSTYSLQSLCLSHLSVCNGRSPLEIAVPAELSTAHYWISRQVHIRLRTARGFQNFLHVWLYN